MIFSFIYLILNNYESIPPDAEFPEGCNHVNLQIQTQLC